jgi:hypothetical protein
VNMTEYLREKEIERTKKPVEILTFDELWEDLGYCYETIGVIERAGWDIAVPVNLKRARIRALKLEITKRIVEQTKLDLDIYDIAVTDCKEGNRQVFPPTDYWSRLKDRKKDRRGGTDEKR